MKKERAPIHMNIRRTINHLPQKKKKRISRCRFQVHFLSFFSIKYREIMENETKTLKSFVDDLINEWEETSGFGERHLI